MPYTNDDMLMLSGIQHYKFCPRQWALIHLEQQWNDNMLTAEGHILHTRVDDPTYRVKYGDTITLRGMHIASSSLGLYGVADAVELIPSDGQDSFIPDIQGNGSFSQLSTSTADKSRMSAMRFSLLPRQCAWRKCFM